MAQSLLELGISTGKWDSGLKKAQSSLNNFIQAQGGLNAALDKENQKIGQFVGMMGKMESTAKTAKGQMNDYKGSIEQLSAAYNRMTDAQKQSIGPAYLQAIDSMKQKFKEAKAQVDALNQSMNDIKAPEISTGGFLGGLGGKLDGMLQVFGGNLMTKGAGMLASLASEMGDMVKQGIELARAGEGIRLAFEKLNNPQLLDGLREATHGTVTDIELMKAAVKFNDFKLPLDQLGTMLAFAQQKAKDTGQSVDYMVDSIVTGLGRKSLMILDNLGLSATEIKDKMAETGDMTKAVGEIIREQMSKAGDYVETAADRQAQATVNVQNKLEEMGRKFQPLAEEGASMWNSIKLGGLTLITSVLDPLIAKYTKLGLLMGQYGNLGGSSKVGRMLGNLGNGGERAQGIYQQQQAQFWKYINPREAYLNDLQKWRSGDRSKGLQERVNAGRERFGVDDREIRAQVDAAKRMLKEYQEGAKGILSPKVTELDKTTQTVDTLKKKLKDLQADYKAAIKSGDSGKASDLLKQINQTKKDIKGLNPDALKTTHTATPAEQAANTIKTAEQEYSRALEKAAMEVDNGRATTADAKKAEYNATMALWTAYSKAADTVPSNEGYRQRMTELESSIKTLGGEVTQSAEAQKASEQAARELAQKQKNLAQATEDAAKAQQTGDLKAFYQAQAKAVQNGGAIAANTNFKASESNVAAFVQHLNEEIAKANPGELLYNQLTSRLKDAQALQTVITQAVKNGVQMPEDFNVQKLWTSIFTENGDIPNETWRGILESINEKLREGGFEPIKLTAILDYTEDEDDDDSGDGKKRRGKTKRQQDQQTDSKNGKDDEVKLTEEFSKLTGGMSSIASGIQSMGVELPEGITKAIGVLQGIMSIVQGISSIVSVIQAVTTAQSVKFWATGGVVHAANGYFVPGNYGYDAVPSMLTSGELVLNRAQQGNLASQLTEGGGQRMGTARASVSGEQIWIALNNFTKASGRGELVTW